MYPVIIINLNPGSNIRRKVNQNINSLSLSLMPQCDCSLKHTNKGVCNCLDNNSLLDWDDEDEDEDWKDVKIEEDDDTTKITKSWDDIVH